MIVFPSLLAGAAEEAGIKVPDDPEVYRCEDFPHWTVFVGAQCGMPMPSPDSHWHNAKVIAAIPDEKIRLVTFDDLISLGFETGYPIP